MRGFDYLTLGGHQPGRHLTRVGLGQFPTPVTCERSRAGTLFVKHDEATHERYGGNKLRKLEFLLGAALARGTPYVATFGAAGSNHALATALHARGLGLQPIAFLSRQARTPMVADTLAAHCRLGTRLIYAGVGAQRRKALRDTLVPLGGRTSVIPMGGSSWLGAMGYIAAAAELAAQIDNGELPVPARIVVPLGTMSTVIGLAMGLAQLALPTQVVAVRVVDAVVANPDRLRRLGDVWSGRLARIVPTLDLAGWLDRIEIVDDQFGDGYARPTAASAAALVVAREDLNLTLENTYSGKALAAALALLPGVAGPTLFWNTYAGGVPALPAIGTPRSAVPDELAFYCSGAGAGGSGSSAAGG